MTATIYRCKEHFYCRQNGAARYSEFHCHAPAETSNQIVAGLRARRDGYVYWAA